MTAELILISMFILAYGQSVDVTEPEPCWQDYTKGTDIFTDCGIEDDFLAFATTPFEYATGGFFSMLLITMLIIATYLKYHKAIYPMVLGTLYFPSVYFLFPPHYVTFAITLMAVGYAIMLYYVMMHQTNDK